MRTISERPPRRNTDYNDPWLSLRELGAHLSDQLALARGAERLQFAASAVRDARLVLETATGPEAEAVRALLAAIEAAYRSIEP